MGIKISFTFSTDLQEYSNGSELVVDSMFEQVVVPVFLSSEITDSFAVPADI
jgi:hypothetical protein